MNSLKERVSRLESMLPQKIDYGQIYDFLFMAEQTIGCPPGSSPEDEATLKFGNRETWINDRRTD